MSRAMRRRRSEHERGSVAVVVAMAMTALMGLAALATDVGRLYVEKHRLASVADAAVLSAAQFLPASPGNAQQAAVYILQQNGVSANASVIQVSDNHRRISVDLQRSVPMTFGRVIGTTDSTVTAGAVAETSNLSGAYGAAPLGVPRANWTLGEQVSLKLDADTGTISPGNYQALALGKSGASMYEQNLMYGYNEWIRMDQWVDTETGNMAGPTVRAINHRINQDPYSTWETANRQSPRLVVVPILKDYDVNGKGQVNVVGFGVFYLEVAVSTGSNKAEITGRFVRMITEGESTLLAPDYGVYTIKLVR